MTFKLNFFIFFLIFIIKINVFILTINASPSTTTIQIDSTSFNTTITRETTSSSSPLDCINSNTTCPFPLRKIGDKQYYLGIFNKFNWFRAFQFCAFHGMHLVSITSQEENVNVIKLLNDFGTGITKFWTSGTDLGDENNYFWMSNGQPIIYTNWHRNEPNNYAIRNSTEHENCLELAHKNSTGFKWNDRNCKKEMNFICELK